MSKRVDAILAKRKMMADGGQVAGNMSPEEVETQSQPSIMDTPFKDQSGQVVDPQGTERIAQAKRINEAVGTGIGLAGSTQIPGGAKLFGKVLQQEPGAFTSGSMYRKSPVTGQTPLQSGAPANQLNLVHYSSNPNLNEIDPNFAGTGMDRGVRGRELENKLSHFYVENSPQAKGTSDEGMIVGKTPHRVSVDLNQHPVYDFGKDSLNIIGKTMDENKGTFSLDKALSKIKEAGYSGFHNPNDTNNPNAVYMMNKMQVNRPSSFQSNPSIRSVAEDYAQSKGLKLQHPTHEFDVSPERGARIANAYENMEHNPDAPAVKKAYGALASETKDQFNHILDKTGLKLDKITGENPYPNGSKDLLKDITQNNHMYYYPTESGFGTGEAPNHPLLKSSGVKIGGEEVPVNDLFRIVHDYFGHAKEGTTFGPKGEENAWAAHMQMFSPEAQKALTTETRGQNSWVNYGPKGAANRANPNSTTFAEQKAGLLPDWTRTEMPTKGRKKYANGGRISYADGGEVSQSDLASYGINSDPYAAPAEPQQPAPGQVDALNVFNPSGELVSIPHHQMADAQAAGYTIPTPQEIEQHLAEQKYSGAGQQILAGAEGLAQGVAGPLATGAELAAGVPSEAIRGREAAYPKTHGLAEMAGLVGGMATGTGEAKLLEMAGEAGLKALTTHEAATAVEKIGSAGVRSMIENATLQSGNEVSKMILQDPDQTAQTALVDIGLSGILGGAAGTALGGTHELWNATVGHKVGQFLNTLSKHAGGIENVVPSDMQKVITDSGLKIEPELNAVLSGDEHAQRAFSVLNQSDTTKSGQALQETVRNFKNQVGEGLVESIGKSASDMEHIQEVNRYEWGKKLGHSVAEESAKQVNPLQEEFEDLKTKYKNAPVILSASVKSEMLKPEIQKLTAQINDSQKGLRLALLEHNVPAAIEAEATIRGTQERLAKLNAGAETHGTSDVAAAQLARLVDKEGWQHSPDIMKEVNHVMERLPQLKSIKDIGDLATAIGNNTASTLPFGQGTPVSRAGSLMKNILREAESDAAMSRLGEEAPNLVDRYKAARAAYAAQSDLKEALDSRLGTRSSTTGFPKAVREMANTDGEGLLRRLSGKNDADLLQILSKNYPKSAEILKQFHLSTIAEQAANKAKAGELVSSGALMKNINSMDPNLRNFILNEAQQTKINALSTLLDKINEVPNHNFSNTGRTMDKLMQHVPGTAAGMATLLTGHGLGAALMVGPMVKMISKDAPDAVRLAMLKFLGSGKQISAPAFKSAVDYIQATIKGQSAINRATKNLFIPGREMLPTAMMPTAKERDQLDKHLQKIQVNPERLTSTGGDTSHYMPEHGGSMGMMASNAVNLLNSLRPSTSKASPLDSKVVLNAAQTSEYTRALNIAQQPLVVLQKIQAGTLVPQDVVLLQKLYPALHAKLVAQLTNEMTANMAKGRPIPYTTRLGLSMFTAQALDSTMQPMSIMAAQPMSNAPQMPPQGSQKAPSESSTKGIAKLPTAYKTPGQAREAERSSGK